MTARALLLAALLAAPAGAQAPLPANWKAVGYDHWGGLNLLNDSTQIDGDAQVAQNVLTDNGYLEKRPGNVRLATILSGSPVKYVTDWAAPNGSRYLVAQASNTIYQTNFSGSPVALSTVATGFNVTTVPAFSKLEFADGFRTLWYWNDSSTAAVTDGTSGALAPICTYIAFKDSRIWCANLPSGFTTTGNTTNGGGSSTVLISSSGGDGYWAVPANVSLVDNAPNRFDFNPDDGDSINCLATTPWGMYVGKRNSSYIVKGDGNLSYDPRLLDPKIGCVDNRSVQMVYGVLEWLAVDGVYGYDGSGPPHLLTRELDPLMALVRESSFSQGQWATQLYPDWASGTESTTTASLPPLPWDYTTVPGEIFPSSFTLYDDNRSPLLQGGVGFSSDTLVNIDTTSFPLSVGVAQVGQSSITGITVWTSTFPNGNYTTIVTTWTDPSSAYQGCNVTFTPGTTPKNCILNVSGIPANLYTMGPSSGTTPGTNNWNFGAWTFLWQDLIIGSPSQYGRCVASPPATCLQFDFISDGKTPNTVASSNGYGLKIVDSVHTSTAVETYTLSLYKVVAGVVTTLSSGQFALNSPIATANFVGFSSVTVTRTPGGYMSAYVNGTLVTSAADSTSAANRAVIARMNLGYNSGGSFSGVNLISSVTFQGFGTGSIVSHVYDTGAGAPLAGVLSSSYTLNGVTTGSKPETEIDFYVRSSTDSAMGDNPSWSASSNSVLATLPKRYWQYEALFTSRIASATAQLQTVSLPAVTTGYYYSQVNFVGPLITTWRQFAVTETTPGVYGYAVRQATYNFAAGDTSIAWTAQTANQNVNLSVSTPTYAQFRLDSTSLTSNPLGASAAEPITAVFLRWDQGASLPVASATLERRYYLCVTISTAATAPDVCLIRQKTGKWVEWVSSGTIGAMGLYNNQIVAADGGTSSRVWEIMQAGVYEDDGVAIDGAWVSEDFTNGLVFNDKVLHEMWFDALPVQGSSVTASYQVNKSSGYVDAVFPLDNGSGINPANLAVSTAKYGDLNQYVRLNAGYETGKYIRVKFEDANLDSYFRINSYLLLIEDVGRTIPP